MTQPPPSVTPLDYAKPEAAGASSNGLLMMLVEAGARVAVLIVIFLAFGGLIGGNFFSASNVESILLQSSVYALGGIGMTLIIITGGIDLAAGSTIALSMVVTAMVLQTGGTDGPWYWQPLAVLSAIATGALVGALQGTLITALRVVPFIITLGGLVAIRGFAKNISDNQEISPPMGWLYNNLMFQVQGREFNWQLFPVGVWGTLAAGVLAAAMLRYTRFGRRIYAIGSNEATARLCGIPVQRTKVLVYAMGGLFFGLAGVLEFARLNLGQPTGALMYELYMIAACVIGGTSLKGGVGSIFGTFVGAIILGLLYVGAGQAGWDKSTQEMAIGGIIILAVAIDQLRNGRLTRSA